MILQDLQRYTTLFPTGTDVTIDQAEKILDKKVVDKPKKKGVQRIVHDNGRVTVTFAQAGSETIKNTVFSVFFDAVVALDHAETGGVTRLTSITGVRAGWGMVTADV